MKVNYKKFVLTILVLGLFLPVFDAQAWSPFELKDFAFGAVENLFSYSLFWFFSILGKVLAVIVSMLDWVVRIRIYTDLPIIQSSWKIMRDFANMLFIIALIVMAYGTIFNIPKYDFKSLIPRFIIIAVLINFSLVLSGLVIDATQVLNNTFLNAMGDISGRLGQGLSPATLLPAQAQISSLGTVTDVAGASIVTLFFGIWFLFAFIISVAVPLAVAFVRIPVLWALLIISPLAWLLSILPATKGAYDKWWHQFLAWNLFLPYYLFFLYFALFFLSQQDVVLAGMLRGPAGQAIVGENFSKFGIQNSVTFGLLFYYILVGIFLIGGTKVAMSAGTFSGTGIVNVAKWGRDRMANRIGWTAAGRAGKGLLEQAKEREEARVNRQTAYITGKIGAATGGRFGERGIYEKTREEQRAKEISKEKDRQKVFANNIDELLRLSKSGSEAQMLAARIRLTELNAISREEIIKTSRMLGGDRSVAANEYINSVDFAKRSKEDREYFDQTLTNSGARKKNATAMIEKDKLTADQVERLINEIAVKDQTGSIINVEDVKEALGKGNKKNLIAIAQAKVRLNIEGANRMDEEIEKALKKMTDDQILEMMSDPAFNINEAIVDAQGNRLGTFRNTFNKVLGTNPKRLENLASKASGNAQIKLDNMARASRRIKTKDQIAPLTTRKQALTPQITQARDDLNTIEKQIRGLQSQPVLKNQPTSASAETLRNTISQLDRKRLTKESEVKSLSDKIDKIDERINSIRTGTPATP